MSMLAEQRQQENLDMNTRSDNLPQDHKEDMASSIGKQVEFYFSDSNLPRDKFLSQRIRESQDGWIDLALIASFNRIKRFDVDVTTLADAIRNWSSMLEVSDDGQRVRRPTPLPEFDEQRRRDMDARTIYAKGFPRDTETTLEEIEKVFSSLGGTVRSVRMRRFPSTKLFKGSVFVEFATEQDAQHVLSLRPPPQPNHVRQPLLLMTKQAYIEKKRQEREKRQSARQAKQLETQQAASDQQQQQQLVEQKLADQDYPKDCLIHFDQVTNETSREDLKAYLAKTGAVVSYVDFSRGDTSGYLRLAAEGGARKAVDTLISSQETVNGVLPVLRVLEGDEERSYWKTIYGLILAKRRTIKKTGRYSRKRQSIPVDSENPSITSHQQDSLHTIPTSKKLRIDDDNTKLDAEKETSPNPRED
jgi:lupus La protein